MAIRKRKWKTAQGVKIAWSYCFDAPGSTRQNRKQVFESGFASKKEATDAEVERRIKEQRDFELQKVTPSAVPGTLAGLLKEFFSEHGAKALAAKTLQRYREMADYLDADLLAMPVPKIKPLHLSHEWNRLLASREQVGRKAGKPLSARLSAISRGWCRAPSRMRNGLGLLARTQLRYRRRSPPWCRRRRKATALSVEQQEQLIAGATTPWGMDVFLELDAATGARRGELLGLQWTDLQANQLMIGRSLSQVGQGVFLKEIEEQENSASSPIPALRPEEAAGAPQGTARNTATTGKSYQDDYIFCNPDGSPLKTDTVSASGLAAVPQSRPTEGVPAFHYCATRTARTTAGGSACR